MRRVLPILCILIASARVSIAYPVSKISFVGNNRVRTVDLLAYLNGVSEVKKEVASHSELVLFAQRAQEQVVAFYNAGGYLRASIDSTYIALNVPNDSAQGYEVRLFVHEGRAYHFGVLELASGATRIANEIGIQYGDMFHDSRLKLSIEHLLKLYEGKGYPLARIVVKSFDLRDSTDENTGYADVRLDLTEGPRAKIGKVVILGNTVTQSDVITRELGLVPGSFYNADELAAARQRVERLGFFESVSEPELYLAKDSTVSILLKVTEANTSAIDGVLGYIPPRNSTETGYFSGLADLSFRNISGTARSASLLYDRRTRESQTLQISYSEPWLFGYPLNAGIGFLERQQDTTFTRTSLNGDVSLRFSSSMMLIGHVSVERVIPSDQPNAAFSTFDSRTVNTGLSASVDTRDNAISPSYGVLALLGATYGVKSIYGPASALDSATPLTEGVRTISFDASGYHTVGASSLIGAIGLHARSTSLESGLLDASDLYRIGGLYTIRGYREEELLASRYAYVNTELRLLTGRYSFFDVFCDNGLTIKDATHSAAAEQARYLLSYGIGAQLESPLGILALSIGLPRSAPVDQAKFHFGLVKQF